MQSVTFDKAKTALVVIDVQNDYFPGGRFVNFGAKRALKKILALRDWARDRGLPVYWVRHTSTPTSLFFRPGTPGRELHSALEPLDGELIVDKTDPNSFLGTGLEDSLKGKGIDTLVVAGMMSWMCIDTTVRSAKDRGFRNLLAHDACAAGWLKGLYGVVTPWSAHKAFMAALGFRHATVLPTEKITNL